MRLTIAAVALAAVPFAGQAASIIDNGTIALGVDNYGQLNIFNDAGRPIGLLDIATNNEATARGCLCEGWGVGIGGGASGSANNDDGISGLTLDSFVNTASTAKSIVSLTGSALKITHNFVPASETSKLYRVQVTIANTGLTDVADVRYTRTFDWDVEPTAFDEYVTIKGTGTTSSLLYSNDNGFENSNPFASRSPIAGGTVNTDFVDSGPTDHGANFDFGFGTIKAGEDYTFDIFYGAAGTEAGALAALGEVSAELYSLGQSSLDPLGTGNGGRTATFVFGFSGVGGDVIVPDPTPNGEVPLPASALLLLSGLGVLGLRRRAGKAG